MRSWTHGEGGFLLTLFPVNRQTLLQFRASKSVVRRFWTIWILKISWSWGSNIGKGPVGKEGSIQFCGWEKQPGSKHSYSSQIKRLIISRRRRRTRRGRKMPHWPSSLKMDRNRIFALWFKECSWHANTLLFAINGYPTCCYENKFLAESQWEELGLFWFLTWQCSRTLEVLRIREKRKDDGRKKFSARIKRLAGQSGRLSHGFIISHQPTIRPSLSQLWSFKIRRTSFLNYMKFAHLLILRL